MKKIILIISIYCSFVFISTAQKPLPDSLKISIDTAKTPVGKIDAYINAGDFYYQYFDALGYSKAADYYEKAREVANATKDSILIGEAYHSLAQVYDAVGEDKLPKALEYYTLFKRTSLRGTDTGRILRSIINIAATQRRLNLNEDCKKSLIELTKLAAIYGKLKNINRANIFAAFSCSLLNDVTNCKKYYGNLNLSNDTLLNTSLSYAKMYHLTKLYLLGKENNYTQGLIAGEDALKASPNISDSMEIYKIMGDFAKKTKDFEKALFFKESESELYGKIFANNGLTSVNNSLLKSELKLKEENADLLLQKQAAQSKLTKWLIIGLICMLFALLGIYQLSTARRKQNIILQEKVAENNLLLKEVHHRVKNNLQIISSFMLLQQLKKNIDKEELIKQLQSKIQTLALIHQKLYKQSTYGSVELQPYFEQLFRETAFTFATNQDAVTYEIEMGDTKLNLDTLTPLALIINELLLNSIKYVSTLKLCNITISSKEENNMLYLSYADNGEGLPDNIQFEITNSTGLRLVKALTRQIKGTVEAKKIQGKQFFNFEIPII
jgi:two-component system, sensor histidine kinase PdtaS